jgi:hypothetical protein
LKNQALAVIIILVVMSSAGVGYFGGVVSRTAPPPATNSTTTVTTFPTTFGNGEYLDNGVLYEERSVNISALTNGTVTNFSYVNFTFIKSGSGKGNETLVTFNVRPSVESLGNWTQDLNATIPPVTNVNPTITLTKQVDPSAGIMLVSNYIDASTSVFLLVASPPSDSQPRFPPPHPVTITKSMGYWNFTIYLNATTITKGQTVNETYTLTNVSGEALGISVTAPLCNPIIYTLGGRVVWAYTPLQVGGGGQYPSGKGLSGTVEIPSSNLQARQVYILSTNPSFGPFTNGQTSWGPYLEVNATISVTQ